MVKTQVRLGHQAESPVAGLLMGSLRSRVLSVERHRDDDERRARHESGRQNASSRQASGVSRRQPCQSRRRFSAHRAFALIPFEQRGESRQRRRQHRHAANVEGRQGGYNFADKRNRDHDKRQGHGNARRPLRLAASTASRRRLLRQDVSGQQRLGSCFSQLANREPNRE